MRVCSKCGIEKDLSKFYIDKTRTYKDGSPFYRYRCISCTKDDSLQYHHKQPPERKYGEFRKNRNLRYIYGIDLIEFNNMLNNQKGKCYLCETMISGKRAHLDHNHTTGKIRKVLCSNCNTGIGLLKESPDFFKKCIKYLEEHA